MQLEESFPNLSLCVGWLVVGSFFGGVWLIEVSVEAGFFGFFIEATSVNHSFHNLEIGGPVLCKGFGCLLSGDCWFSVFSVFNTAGFFLSDLGVTGTGVSDMTAVGLSSDGCLEVDKPLDSS